MSAEIFQEEFSHTILHGRNVFAEHNAKKKQSKTDVTSKLERLGIDEYEPEGVTKEHFKEEFRNYVEILEKGGNKPKQAINPYREPD